MPTFKEEVDAEYLLLSGHEHVVSRQAIAIIRVMQETIERQTVHIRSIEDRLLALQNTDYFLKNYLLSNREDKISIDSALKNG